MFEDLPVKFEFNLYILVKKIFSFFLNKILVAFSTKYNY